MIFKRCAKGRGKLKRVFLIRFQARVNGECVGAIVCKLDYHKKIVKRGYIAMLAVDSGHRKRKIGSTLVKRAIDAMIAEEADEVTKIKKCGFLNKFRISTKSQIQTKLKFFRFFFLFSIFSFRDNLYNFKLRKN